MDWDSQLKNATTAHLSAKEEMWELIGRIKKDANISESRREVYLDKLYKCLSDQDIRQGFARDSLRFDIGTSFRSSINSLRKLKHRMKLEGVNIFPGGNPKLKDRAFAQAFSVPVPRTLEQNIRLNEIELVPNTILKPVEGSSSQGVFYVDGELRLTSIRTARVYETLEDIKDEINRYRKSISTNRWVLEEAIVNNEGHPANDFKVYTFYGKCGMFLEVNRSSEAGPKYATYNEAGESIRLNERYEVFSGSGVPDEVREYSKRLSLAAPVPFLRLDFHYGSTGLFLGEITPHPGGTYAGQLFEEVDRMLGKYFEDARARLLIDLLSGKEFPEFHDIYESSKRA